MESQKHVCTKLGEKYIPMRRGLDSMSVHHFEALEYGSALRGEQEALVDTLPGEVGEVVLYGAQLDQLTGYLNRPTLRHKFVSESFG
jgi:hypothetical protein